MWAVRLTALCPLHAVPESQYDTLIEVRGPEMKEELSQVGRSHLKGEGTPAVCSWPESFYSHKC